MKPIDAIEFALRWNNGRLPVSRIHDLVKDLVNEDGVNETQLLALAHESKGRFLVRNGDEIELHPQRVANRVRFFREQIGTVHEALRMNAFAPPSYGLELALIYACAIRSHEQLPRFDDELVGLRSVLEELTREFPEFGRDLRVGLDDAWWLTKANVHSALLLMTSVRLTPIEYVQVMRDLFSEELSAGQFCLPWTVADLMTRLLGPDVQAVFDPAADSSVLPVVLAANPTATADALFLNRFAQFFTTLQARILSSELNSLDGMSMPPASTVSYLHCISAPPFGGQVKIRSGQRSRQPAVLAIDEMVRRLAPGGRAVVLVGENLLFSSGAASAIRRQLLDQGLLSAVISLPVGVFRYAGIKTSVLLLENKQAGNSDVVFVDAGEYLTTNSPRHKVIDGERLTKALYKGSEVTGVVHASYAAVKKHDSLSMARFQALESTAYSEVERLNEFVPLRKVIKTQLGVRDTIGEAPYFQVSELASDIVDIVRRADSGRKDRPRSARSAKLIEEPALLVARVGGTLKPTIFDPGAGPVAIGSNVFAFRVDEKRVDLRYLALELRSGAVQEQLDAYSSGSGVRAISKADLLQLLVRVPDLATQRRIIEQQYDLGLFMEQIKEGAGPLEQEMDQFVRLIEKNISRLGHSGLRKVLTDWREHERTVAVRLLTNRAKENMKMLRHQFNNRLGWVTTGLGNVSTFIDHLVDEGVIPEDMPIAPSLEGEEAPSPSIVATIEQLHRNAEQLPELFGRLSDSFERSDLNPEYIEMDEFIRTSILPLYENDKRFRLVMGEPRSNSTSAYVDRFAMEQVICNIIDNAVKHGFTDGGKNYHLYIEVEGEMLIIANDGAPPSIDLGEMKIRGRSVGPNAGSGEGMYWADALMQQMGGKLMQMYNAEEYFQAPISFCISMNLPVAS